MSGTHTPGPWKVGYRVGHEWPILAQHDGHVIARVRDMKNPRCARAAAANALLLSAAPDMLAVLVDLLASDEANDYPDIADARRAARAAVTKAEGGAS